MIYPIGKMTTAIAKQASKMLIFDPSIQFIVARPLAERPPST